MPDVEITLILTILKTWNPHLTVLTTILRMILKVNHIIYEYF